MPCAIWFTMVLYDSSSSSPINPRWSIGGMLSRELGEELMVEEEEEDVEVAEESGI